MWIVFTRHEQINQNLNEQIKKPKAHKNAAHDVQPMGIV